MGKDYYKILSVKPNATQSEINEAVNRVLAVWGSITPENDPNFDRHSKLLSDIIKASRVLKDPARRLDYDIQQGHRQRQSSDLIVDKSVSEKLKEVVSLETLSTVNLPGRLKDDRLGTSLALIETSKVKPTFGSRKKNMHDSDYNKGHDQASKVNPQRSLSSESPELSSSDDDDIHDRRSSTLAKLAEWFNRLHFNIKTGNKEKQAINIVSESDEKARDQVDTEEPESQNGASDLTENSKIKCSFSHNDISQLKSKERGRLLKDSSRVAKDSSTDVINLFREISGKTTDSRNAIRKAKDSFEGTSPIRSSPKDTGNVLNMDKWSKSEKNGLREDGFHRDSKEIEVSQSKMDEKKSKSYENKSTSDEYMIISCSDSDESVKNNDSSPNYNLVQPNAIKPAETPLSAQKSVASTLDKLNKKRKSVKTTNVPDNVKSSAPGKDLNENEHKNGLLSTYKLDTSDKSAEVDAGNTNESRTQVRENDKEYKFDKVQAMKKSEKPGQSAVSGFKSKNDVISKCKENSESSSVENKNLLNRNKAYSVPEDEKKKKNNLVSSRDVLPESQGKIDVKLPKCVTYSREKNQKDPFTRTKQRTVSFSFERDKRDSFPTRGTTHSKSFDQTRLKPVLKNSGSSSEKRELMKHMFHIPVFKPIPTDSLELITSKMRISQTEESAALPDSRETSLEKLDETEGEPEMSNATLAKKIADSSFGVLKVKNIAKSEEEIEESITRPHHSVPQHKASSTEEPESSEAIEQSSSEESQRPLPRIESASSQNKKGGEIDTEPASGRFSTGKTRLPEKIDVMSQECRHLKQVSFQDLLKTPKIDSSKNISLTHIVDGIEHTSDGEGLARSYRSMSLPPKTGTLIHKDAAETISDNDNNFSECSAQQIRALCTDKVSDKSEGFIKLIKPRRTDLETRDGSSRQTQKTQLDPSPSKMKNREDEYFRKIPVDSLNLLHSKRKKMASFQESEADRIRNLKNLDPKKVASTTYFPETMAHISKEFHHTNSSEEWLESAAREPTLKDTSGRILENAPVDSIVILKRKKGKQTIKKYDSEENAMEKPKHADFGQPLTESNALKMLEEIKAMMDSFCQRFSKPEDCKGGIVASDHIQGVPQEVSMMESDTNVKELRSKPDVRKLDNDPIYSRSPNIESITIDTRKRSDVPKLEIIPRESRTQERIFAYPVSKRRSHPRTVSMISDTLPSACSIPGVKSVAATTLLTNASIKTVYHFGIAGTELIEVFVDDDLRAKIVKDESHDAYCNVMKQDESLQGPNISASNVIAANGCEMRTDVSRRDGRETISVYKNGELLCKTGSSVVQ